MFANGAGSVKVHGALHELKASDCLPVSLTFSVDGIKLEKVQFSKESYRYSRRCWIYV